MKIDEKSSAAASAEGVTKHTYKNVGLEDARTIPQS